MNADCDLCSILPQLPAAYAECSCNEFCGALRCRSSRPDGSTGLDTNYRLAFGFPVFIEHSIESIEGE